MRLKSKGYIIRMEAPIFMGRPSSLDPVLYFKELCSPYLVETREIRDAWFTENKKHAVAVLKYLKEVWCKDSPKRRIDAITLMQYTCSHNLKGVKNALKDN
jgi:hypothetical protein